MTKQTTIVVTGALRVNISYKLTPKEAICMKCQSLFSEKNIETILQYNIIYIYIYISWVFFLPSKLRIVSPVYKQVTVNCDLKMCIFEK